MAGVEIYYSPTFLPSLLSCWLKSSCFLAAPNYDVLEVTLAASSKKDWQSMEETWFDILYSKFWLLLSLYCVYVALLVGRISGLLFLLLLFCRFWEIYGAIMLLTYRLFLPRHDRFFCLFSLCCFIYLNALCVCAQSDVYHNTWVLEIKGGPNTARTVAANHGMELLDQVFCIVGNIKSDLGEIGVELFVYSAKSFKRCFPDNASEL